MKYSPLLRSIKSSVVYMAPLSKKRFVDRPLAEHLRQHRKGRMKAYKYGSEAQLIGMGAPFRAAKHIKSFIKESDGTAQKGKKLSQPKKQALEEAAANLRFAGKFVLPTKLAFFGSLLYMAYGLSKPAILSLFLSQAAILPAVSETPSAAQAEFATSLGSSSIYEDDPVLEDIITEDLVKFIEYYASELPGKGAADDLLAAIVKYPRLAIYVNPDCPDILVWLYDIFSELKDAPKYRQMYLEILGDFSTKQQFYEPIEFSVAMNRKAFPQHHQTMLDWGSHQRLKKDQEYQQVLVEPEVLLDPKSLYDLVNDPNELVVKDTLIKIAEYKTNKALILEKLNDPANFEVYGAALEALAIWGDGESIRILEDTVREGSFQAHIFVNLAMRKHLSADQLKNTIDSFLMDQDPFTRGAGLKLLQFVWHKEGFDEHNNYFLEKVKDMADFDMNNYVRMAAIECLGYSHHSEIVSWLEYFEREPELKPFIKAAKEHIQYQTIPEGYDNVVDFLSDSYLNPIQSKWITDSLREMAREGKKPLRVLMVGCSYGPEAFSHLIEIMKDYENDPAAWGNFDPQKDLKLIISDIDTQALLYSERGYYHFDGKEYDNEFDGMEFYHGVYGTDFEHDLHHFFEAAPGAHDQYRLRQQYLDMLEVRYLDATKMPEKPQAEIVVFNKMDYLFAGNPSATADFLYVIFSLTSRYVTYTTWANSWTKGLIGLHGTPIHESDPLGFCEKRSELNENQ